MKNRNLQPVKLQPISNMDMEHVKKKSNKKQNFQKSAYLESKCCTSETESKEDNEDTTEQELDAVLLKKWKILKRVSVVLTRLNNCNKDPKLSKSSRKMAPKNVQQKKIVKNCHIPQNGKKRKMSTSKSTVAIKTKNTDLKEKQKVINPNLCFKKIGKKSKNDQNVMTPIMIQINTDNENSVTKKKRSRNDNVTPKFYCDECEYSVSTAPRDVASHNKKYHSGSAKNFHCKFCSKSFAAQFMLNRHLASNCPEPFKRCYKCFEYFREEDFQTHGNAPPLICTFKSCKKAFYCPGYYKFHTSAHKKLYPCSQCNKRFAVKHSLKAHIEVMHMKLKRFLCDSCDSGFLTPGKLSAHFRLVHQPKIRKFICDICGHCFLHKADIRSHMIVIHFATSGVKKFSCSICQKHFITKRQYNGHLRTHIKHQFSCDQCYASYAHLDKLEKHKIQFHSNKNIFFCKICGHGSRTAKLHSVHRMGHLAEYNLTCDICNKKFKSKGTLKVHIGTHFANLCKRFSCQKCPYSCNTKYKLKLHSRTHSDTYNYTCDICCKKFKARHTMKCHIWTHFPDRDKPFSCHLCTYRCDKKFVLKIHMATHEGRKHNIACDKCDKKFMTEGGRQIHMKTHIPYRSRRFACHLCSYRAHRSYRIKQHIKLSHA